MSDAPTTPVIASENARSSIAATPHGSYPGAPLEPTSNPMLAGVGPGAWADRADRLDVTVDGYPKIRPMRAIPGFYVDPRDPDPRGMVVVGLDEVEAGVVVDLWVDLSEPQVRYLEVAVHANGRNVLLPIPFSRVDTQRRRIKVKSIMARHFADVPGTQHPELVTLLEEDKISAYFGAGYLYATPDRVEPII